MPNDPLVRALIDGGAEIEDLCRELDVSWRQAQVWLSGKRDPDPWQRAAIARYLRADAEMIWPGPIVVPATAANLTNGPILVDAPKFLEARGEASVPEPVDWTELLTSAEVEVNLLGYTLLEWLQTPGVLDVLSEKAAAGVYVRINIASPYSFTVAEADRELYEPLEMGGRVGVTCSLNRRSAKRHLRPGGCCGTCRHVAIWRSASTLPIAITRCCRSMIR